MENKYLEKIASWQEQPVNKYLEKIAGFLSTIGGWMGGSMNTIRRGGGTAGSTFNALDQMAGKGIRTIQRASQNKVSLTSGIKDPISNITGHKGLLGGKKPTLSPTLKPTTKLALTDNRKEAFRKIREQRGTVKDPTKDSFNLTNKGIKNRKQGYAAPNPNAPLINTTRNTYLDKVNRKIGANQLNNQHIGTARAKLAIGAAGVAGVGSLGYHIANKNSQPQYQDYGTMPY